MKRDVAARWERANAIMDCSWGTAWYAVPAGPMCEELHPHFFPVAPGTPLAEWYWEIPDAIHIDVASLLLDGLACEDLP